MKARLLNAAGLVLCLGTSAWLSLELSGAAALDAPETSPRPHEEDVSADSVRDANDVLAEAGSYQRIASLNPVADHLLLRLVEPRRLIAITDVTDRGHPDRWRFGSVEVIGRSDPLESLLVLRPDLVITSQFVDVSRAERMRESGITVFNLGEMRGVQTTLKSIDVLGRLLTAPKRAQFLRERYERDLRALRAVPRQAGIEGIYVSVYGDSFFGGTVGTSYGDVLELAGIRDLAAAAGFVDWPQYTAEQLLVLDPPILVTREGTAASIRAHPILSRLRAARQGGQILEIQSAYDGDAGLGVVPAAAALQHSLFEEQEPER